MVMNVVFEAIRSVVEPLDTAERRKQHRLNRFPKFSDMRDHDRMYRWGLIEEGDPALLDWLLSIGVTPETIDQIIASCTLKI